MVRTFLRKSKRRSLSATTGDEKTLDVLDETHHEPRYRNFSAEEEWTQVKKVYNSQAIEAVPVTQGEEASVLLVGDCNPIDLRVMHEAGLYYASQQCTQRHGVEARDDVHEMNGSFHRKLSFASNRFSSIGIDINFPQDSESDSGVELEYYKYDQEQEASQRSSHGFMKIISSMFRLQSSKRSLTDTTQEESFDDSISETGPPPEVETVEFVTNSPEATSTISESTDGVSNASNDGSDEENDNENREYSDEEEEDDLFEDGLFQDYEDSWNERILNCFYICRYA